MGFRSWLLSKLTPSQPQGASPRSGYALSDADREASARLRAIDAKLARRERELELMQRARELDALEAEINEEDDGHEDVSTEDYMARKFIDIVEKRLERMDNKGQTQYTDDDIRSWLSKQKPAQIKAAKGMDDKDLIPAIKSQMPGLPDATVNRAIEILRAEF